MSSPSSTKQPCSERSLKYASPLVAPGSRRLSSMEKAPAMVGEASTSVMPDSRYNVRRSWGRVTQPMLRGLLRL
ncbi:hypothetical protein D9M73_262070 [compost metagenome]